MGSFLRHCKHQSRQAVDGVEESNAYQLAKILHCKPDTCMQQPTLLLHVEPASSEIKVLNYAGMFFK